LLQLGSDLVVREHSVSAFSDVDLVGDALVVAFLSLEVVELLSQLGDQGILVARLDTHRLVVISPSVVVAHLSDLLRIKFNYIYVYLLLLNAMV